MATEKHCAVIVFYCMIFFKRLPFAACRHLANAKHGAEAVKHRSAVAEIGALSKNRFEKTEKNEATNAENGATSAEIGRESAEIEAQGAENGTASEVMKISCLEIRCLSTDNASSGVCKFRRETLFF